MGDYDFIKQLDELGRLTLPSGVRQRMGIQENDEIEIIADRERDAIILKKKKPTCIFCNSAEHLTAYKGKHICRVCALSISSSND